MLTYNLTLNNIVHCRQISDLILLMYTENYGKSGRNIVVFPADLPNRPGDLQRVTALIKTSEALNLMHKYVKGHKIDLPKYNSPLIIF